MTERLLILLPTPIMLPPINGLSPLTRPLGVAFAASSVGAAALWPPGGEFVVGCPLLLVPPGAVFVFGVFDWPKPDKPKLFPWLRIISRRHAGLRSGDSGNLEGLRRLQASDELASRTDINHPPCAIFLLHGIFIGLAHISDGTYLGLD